MNAFSPMRETAAGTGNGPDLPMVDFARVARIMERESGVTLPSAKLVLVQSRLARRVRDTGLTNFSDYVAMVERDAAERTVMVEALTTNHTRFFREQHHFDHLEREVVPQLIECAGRRPVRLWSAGCSSGEEPWSIAMTLAGEHRNCPPWIVRGDVRILATDINTDMIRTVQGARYPAEAKANTPARLAHHWREEGSQVTVSPALRDLVVADQLNLFEAWPMKCRFDVIFCRNVMIYFDAPRRAALVARFADALRPGGMLYIGHSERLDPATLARFEALGQTSYRKLEP